MLRKEGDHQCGGRICTAFPSGKADMHAAAGQHAGDSMAFVRCKNPVWPCRREGNRKAAQRLRQRRMETVSNLQGEIARLEQERLVYLNHIYQLAASARSVVGENKLLRARLEALQQGSADGLVRAARGCCAHASPACGTAAPSACHATDASCIAVLIAACQSRLTPRTLHSNFLHQWHS